MKSIAISFLCIFVITSTISAQRVKTVEGEATYIIPKNVSQEEAEHIAVERAKIQALADEFGTIVGNETNTQIRNQDGRSSINFQSIGFSEVRGEWIDDVMDPKISFVFEDGFLCVHAYVKGKARAIETAQTAVEVMVVTHRDDQIETTTIQDGGDIFVRFQSPIDGYVVIYLVDSKNTAQCLLPYKAQSGNAYPVKGNHPYIFFSAKDVDRSERATIDEYCLTCDGESEMQTIYILFSSYPFAKATDEDRDSTLPRELSVSKFRKWLVKARNQDKQMVVVTRNLMIQK